MSSGSRIQLVIAVLAVAILYAIADGLAWRLTKLGVLDASAFRVIHYPLTLASDTFPILERPISAYLGLWWRLPPGTVG